MFSVIADTYQRLVIQISSTAQLPTMPNHANTTISAAISILTLLSIR